MADAPAAAPAPVPATVTIDDFRKLEFRVAKVLSVDVHPNADKLYVIKVDAGADERQIVSGIRQHYQPGDLVGKSVVVIMNLQPAVIRGVESRGMLLAASGGGDVSVLVPVREVPAGSKVS